MNRIEIEFPATNVTKVWTKDMTVLFSYTTPIAIWDKRGEDIKRYGLKHCHTTINAKHLNKWGPASHLHEGDHYETLSQEAFDALMARD